MKHRKQPLDLGEVDSVSGQSYQTPNQQPSAKRKRLEETGCDSAERLVTPQDTRKQSDETPNTFTDRAVNEIEQLFASREALCSDFFGKKTDIPELCLALDDIGKNFEKISIISQYYNHGKFLAVNQIAEIAHKCENEMLLTRLILKSIIEYLSRTQQLKINTLLAEELPAEDPFFMQEPNEAQNRCEIACVT
jgi:hypothetical protein